MISVLGAHFWQNLHEFVLSSVDLRATFFYLVDSGTGSLQKEIVEHYSSKVIVKQLLKLFLIFFRFEKFMMMLKYWGLKNRDVNQFFQ